MTELQKALTELKKKNTDLKIGSLSDFDMVAKAYTTGNLVLDTITTIGGFPKGRIVELSGATMSGKTTAAIQCAVEHQKAVKEGKASGAIFYADYENALDEEYARSLGLDVEDEETFIYMQPEDFEEGFNAFRFLLSKGLLAMCIIDSVAAMVPRSEKEKETGAVTIADRAKALHQGFRQVTSELRKKNCTMILINHVMEVIPTDFASKKLAAYGVKKKTRPGGTSIEYYSSMRIEFTQIKEVKTETLNDFTQELEKRVTSTEVQATVFKNKVGLPHKYGRMRVRFGKGFSQPFSALQALIVHKIVKKRAGGYYDFPDDLLPDDGEIPRTEDALLAKMESDTEWLDRLVVRAKQAISDYDKDSDTLDELEFDPETGELLGGMKE